VAECQPGDDAGPPGDDAGGFWPEEEAGNPAQPGDDAGRFWPEEEAGNQPSRATMRARRAHRIDTPKTGGERWNRAINHGTEKDG
jgi:hypothetical protein